MTIREKHRLEMKVMEQNERSRDRAQMTISMVFSPIQQTRLSEYGI